MRSRSYLEWVSRTMHAGAQPNISAAEYARLPIPALRIKQQRIVVATLDLLERQARVVTDLVGAKRRFKRGLTQELLTGQRRFTDFGGEPWSEIALGELFTERVERGRADLPLLSITADQGVIPRDQLERRDTSNDAKSAYLRVAPGDIGYTNMRMGQGGAGR